LTLSSSRKRRRHRAVAATGNRRLLPLPRLRRAASIAFTPRRRRARRIRPSRSRGGRAGGGVALDLQRYIDRQGAGLFMWPVGRRQCGSDQRAAG
jgi:hypothetical protein